MGRNRVPDEIAVLRGNPRKRKIKRGADAARSETAAVPSDAAASPAPAGEVMPAPPAGTLAAPPPPAGGLPLVATQSVVPAGSYPDGLTHARERLIYQVIVDEFMPRNLVRATDVQGYVRYATYMHMWLSAKEQLAAAGGGTSYLTETKHGKIVRRHPAFMDMLDLGHELRQQEIQLALTPLARTALLARLAAPQLPPPNMFPSDDDKPAGEQPPAADPVGASPLGFMQMAGRA